MIENVSDNYIVLGKGGDYNIHGYVYFNNVRYYDGVEIKCEIADTSIATADDNMTIAAKNVGETEMILSTTWKGFSGSTLQKTVKVKVVEDVEANTFVTVGETTEITDKIRLSLVGKWQGKTYDDFATLTGELIVGGERQNVTFEYIKEDGSDVISIKDNKVVAENIGSSYVEARCSYNGVEYVNVIEIAVTCPVEEYEGSFDYCVSEDFDVNNVFGAGAVILSATQGDRKLTVKRGKLITDIVPRGRETEEICVLSSLGGYVFKSVNAYTKAIKTADEFIEAPYLESGREHKRLLLSRQRYYRRYDLADRKFLRNQRSAEQILRGRFRRAELYGERNCRDERNFRRVGKRCGNQKHAFQSYVFDSR